MNNYQSAKIYKIVDLNEVMKPYIGSTTMALEDRFSRHKSQYKSKSGNLTVYKIFDAHGVNNCKILLIENYPCESRTELEKREGEFMKSIECINKNRAGVNYKENPKEYTKTYNKQYYIKNKDNLLMKRKIQYHNKKKQLTKNINTIYTNIIDSNIESLLDLMDISTD